MDITVQGRTLFYAAATSSLNIHPGSLILDRAIMHCYTSLYRVDYIFTSMSGGATASRSLDPYELSL